MLAVSSSCSSIVNDMSLPGENKRYGWGGCLPRYIAIFRLARSWCCRLDGGLATSAEADNDNALLLYVAKMRSVRVFDLPRCSTNMSGVLTGLGKIVV
jgi:hypothetical protein